MSENKITYIERKYRAFIDKHGYIPKVFDAYNERDCGGVSPTLTTNSTPGSAGVCLIIVYEDEE